MGDALGGAILTINSLWIAGTLFQSKCDGFSTISINVSSNSEWIYGKMATPRAAPVAKTFLFLMFQIL